MLSAAVIARSRILRLILIAAASGWASYATAGQRFVDDFTRPSDAWRYGSAARSSGRGALLFDAWYPEVTLLGTHVHPENLRTFAASVQWRFGRTGQPFLVIGWGKPFEWSRFDECAVQLAVGRDGRVAARAGKETLGAGQLPAPKGEVWTLSFAQEARRIVLRTGQGDAAFALSDAQECRAGYLTLRVQGLAAAPGEEPLKVLRVELDGGADLPPLTPDQRSREIQAWATGRIAANRAVLERFKAHLRAEAAAGRWGYPTDMTVEPGLVRPGEKVRATLRAAAPLPSPNEARVESDFLAAAPGKAESLSLKWEPDGRGGHVATTELSPQAPGNWRVVWRAGQEELSRGFAVVGPGYAVCRLLVTTHAGMGKPGRAPEAYHAIHGHGLAADFWEGAEWVSPFSRTPENLLSHFRILREMRHRWGDRILPLCNANWLIPGCPDTNLWRLDDEVQREGLEQVVQLWDALGLGPLELLGSYTFGHSTPRIARSLGVKAIDSLVPWQNWRDGPDDNAWLINQWGAPTVPYYVADDDFRKVAPGRSIVALPQATTSSVRIYYVNTLEGEPQLSFLRRRSQDMGETANSDRFQTAVALWLAEAPHQPEPLFLSVGFENFLDSPDWREANRLGVNCLREQARHKKLVFASGADIADFFHRHYDRQPESWLFWPNIYAGLQAGYMPRQVPDRIELSNAQFHSLHEDGSALPRFLWDFTRPWAEPVWSDQADIRQKFGLVNPDLLTADNSVPRMSNLGGIRAGVAVEPDGGGVRLRVTVEAPRRVEALPVAVWRIPLASEGLAAAETSTNARFIRVVDGSTGNLHGVVVCEGVPAGTSVWTVSLRGASRIPVEPNLRIGRHVRGRMFLRDGAPFVYLWLAEESAPNGLLRIRVPAGRSVSVHYNDGRRQEASGGLLAVVLDRAWQHESPLLSGLTAGELQSLAAFEPTPVPPAKR